MVDGMSLERMVSMLNEKLLPGTPCPQCTMPTLEAVTRFEAQPIGTFSLSGSQMKVSAREAVYIVCSSCDMEATVNREG